MRVVLLHGMGHDSGQVAGVRARLEARGVVVVTPDLIAEPLDAMVDHVADLVEPGAVVGGVSMGAAVSMAYALRPDSVCGGLMLIAPAHKNEAARPYVEWLADTVEDGGFDALRDAGEPMADEWAQRFGDSAALVRLWRSALADRRTLDPAGVRVPTLVAGWPDDDLHPIDLARRTADEIPGATFVEVPTPGAHNLPARELAAAFFERFTAI